MAVQPAVSEFGEWLAGEYRADGKYEGVEVLTDGEVPGSELAVRLKVVNRSFYEVRVVDGERRELQVGFGTEHRVVNEEIEEMILENGGDLNDLLGEELCDLGEEEFPMEHFFERPVFRFIVRLPLEGAEALQDPALRRRTRNILKACHILFQGCVDEA